MLFCAGLTLAACDDGGLGSARPQIRVEPERVDFGPTAAGSSSERFVLIRNQGGSTLQISNIAIVDDARSVFGLALRILNDTAAAEEVTLEVYSQVWRQASSYDPRRGTPSAWLLTIAGARSHGPPR